jgi:hypothetical protein
VWAQVWPALVIIGETANSATSLVYLEKVTQFHRRWLAASEHAGGEAMVPPFLEHAIGCLTTRPSPAFLYAISEALEGFHKHASLGPLLLRAVDTVITTLHRYLGDDVRGYDFEPGAVEDYFMLVHTHTPSRPHPYPVLRTPSRPHTYSVVPRCDRALVRTLTWTNGGSCAVPRPHPAPANPRCCGHVAGSPVRCCGPCVHLDSCDALHGRSSKASTACRLRG